MELFFQLQIFEEKKIHFIKKIPKSHVLKNFSAVLVGGLGAILPFSAKGG